MPLYKTSNNAKLLPRLFRTFITSYNLTLSLHSRSNTTEKHCESCERRRMNMGIPLIIYQLPLRCNFVIPSDSQGFTLQVLYNKVSQGCSSRIIFFLFPWVFAHNYNLSSFSVFTLFITRVQ